MKRDLRLFIDGEEVELQKNPNILFTYSVDEVLNPTAVKNTFSKSVDIPGTKKNDRIFNGVFHLDRTGFDGGKKIPFQIFADNILYEEGYCKLEKIKRQLGTTYYTLSFFGGLGSMFYSLSFKEDEQGVSNKKTLADLVYRYEGEGSEEVDLDFTINKDTVVDAWNNVEGWSTKWRFLNFAPAYNGLPDDFDSDKVLIETQSTSSGGGRGGSSIPSVTEDGNTYSPYGGYVLAELDREYVESEMREFRSYLQRPVVRCMEVIKACCLPENNGGYHVNLDPKFFNVNNPYWYGTWCTLPLLTSFDYIGQEETTAVTLNLQSATAQTTGYTYVEKRDITLSDYVDSSMNVTAKVKLSAVIPGATADAYYPTAYSAASGVNYYGGVIVQLVAYDAFGRAVAGSNPQFLCSAYGSRRVSEGRGSGRSQIYAVFPKLEDFDWTAPYGSTYDNHGGGFKLTGSTYEWKDDGGGDLKVTANNIPIGSTLKLEITKIYKQNSGTNNAMSLWERIEQGGQYTQYFKKDMTNFNVSLEDVRISFASNETIRSNSLFTKKTVLSTDFTPCDFLLSFCKIFGLFFRTNPDTREVDILTRENFFSGVTVDLQDRVDRQDMQINPVSFSKKWYKYAFEDAGSEYAENYKKVYGKDYGQTLVDTGYQFNADTEDLFKDSIFKGAVQCTEKSSAYAFSPDNPERLPFTFYGYKYLLFNEQDATDTYEVTKPAQGTFDAFSGVSNALYFDLFSKTQLHTADNSPSDGGGVLMLFDGMQDLSAPNGADLGYYVTDDSSYMKILNDGTPCWLYTRSETDSQGNDIARKVSYCPRFGRYIVYQGSGYITKSLDFGEPETLYIPGAVSTVDSTLYDEWWKDYISDMYHIDTRIVNTKVLFKGRITVDDLRKWYVFDNCLWRLSKISDWNIAEDGLVSCEFVKVNDMAAYNTKDVTYDPLLSVTLSKYNIGVEGETIAFSAFTSDGGSWYAEIVDDDNITMTPDHASGGTTGTITIGRNSWGGSQREYVIWFFADPASVKVVITQEAEILSIGMSWNGNVPASGATVPVTVEAQKAWTASSPYNWVTLTQSTGGSGTTNFNAVWAPNSGNTTREAYLTIQTATRTGRSSSLRQDGVDVPFMILSPSNVTDFPASGGTLTFTIVSTNVSTWWAYSNQTWAKFSNGNTNMSGDTGTISINIEPNTGDSRYLWFAVNDANYGVGVVNMMITQSAGPGESITVEPATLSGASLGETLYATVYSNEPWSGQPDSAWISVSPDSGNSGYTQVGVTVARNYSVAPRTGSVSFYRESEPSTNPAVLTVAQEGKESKAGQALTFIRVSGTSVYEEGIYVNNQNNNTDLYYSYDSGETMQTIAAEAVEYLPLMVGQSLMFVGTSKPSFSMYVYDGNSYLAVNTGTTDSKYVVEGNPLSVLYGENFFLRTTLDSSLSSLFQNMQLLVDAHELALPATEITATQAYYRMFNGCSELVYPPEELPAENPANRAYEQMFWYCPNLVESPQIGIVSGGTSAMTQMFEGCTVISDIYLPNFSPASQYAGKNQYYRILRAASSAGTLHAKSGVTFERGADYIPTTWTVVDAT